MSEFAARFLSVAPSIVTIVCFLSPLKTVRRIRNERSVGKLPILPFLTLFVNCAIWLAYGVCKTDYTVIVPNALGLVMGFVYTFVYVMYCKSGNTSVRNNFLVAFLVVLYLMYRWTFSPSHECGVFGSFGAFSSVLLGFSPLAAILTVIQDKSVASMPFLTSFSLFISAVLWTSYGYYVARDYYIWAPNSLGVIAGSLQMLCHLRFNDSCRVGGVRKGDVLPQL